MLKARMERSSAVKAYKESWRGWDAGNAAV